MNERPKGSNHPPTHCSEESQRIRCGSGKILQSVACREDAKNKLHRQQGPGQAGNRRLGKRQLLGYPGGEKQGAGEGRSGKGGASHGICPELNCREL